LFLVFIVAVLLVLVFNSRHSIQDDGSHFVIQIGTLNKEGDSDLGLFLRYYVAGGKFDSKEATREFGKVEKGQIKVVDPNGKEVYQSLLTDDIRNSRTFSTNGDPVSGIYTVKISFSHKGRSQKFTEKIEVDAETFLEYRKPQIEVVDNRHIQLDWEDVLGAKAYHVWVRDMSVSDGGRTVVLALVDNSYVDFGGSDSGYHISLEPGKTYRVNLTAYGERPESNYVGQVNVSESYTDFTP
jgi:hypothetical protein